MSVTIEEAKKIARLAHLEFSEEELTAITSDMNSVLEYMEKLNSLNTDTVEPLENPLGTVNAFREDKTFKTISVEEALSNAPAKTESHFKVPKVIGG